MDDPEDTNRIRKVESRKKAQKLVPGTRAYLHSMTNSRVKRNKATLEKADKRKKEVAK